MGNKEILVKTKESIGYYIYPMLEDYFFKLRDKQNYFIYLEDLTYIEMLIDLCLVELEDLDRTRGLYLEVLGFLRERKFKGEAGVLISNKLSFILEDLSGMSGMEMYYEETD